MRRLLVLLFWRGRTPGPWADRIYLIIVGAAVVFVYVRLALLLLGVWPLNLPFGIESWTPSMPSFGGEETPAKSATASPRPSSTNAAGDVEPDEVDPDAGADEPLVANDGRVRDEEAGVRFVLPAAYDAPGVWKSETGTLWQARGGRRTLTLAADRLEPSSASAAWTGLWQRTVAALSDDERLPSGTLVHDLPNQRVFFVESRGQAGLAAQALDRTTGRPTGDERAAFVCETMLFEIGGQSGDGRVRAMTRDVRRVCDSYAVLGRDGDRLSLRRIDLREQGLRITTPSTYVLRPYAGAGYLPEDPTLMARTIVERVPPGIPRVRGWLEVAPATTRDEPPAGSGSEILAFLEGPGGTVGLGFESELAWDRVVVSEGQGVVRAESTFRVVQDGRTWRGRVWWWFSGGRKVALALAAPASSYEWQQLVFKAVADSMRGVAR